MLYTCYVFINPISKGSPCFPYVLFFAYCALDEIYYVVYFAFRLMFFW